MKWQLFVECTTPHGSAEVWMDLAGDLFLELYMDMESFVSFAQNFIDIEVEDTDTCCVLYYLSLIFWLHIHDFPVILNKFSVSMGNMLPLLDA